MRSLLLLCLITCFMSASLSFAATGKISGTIRDAKTNEPLIGANVIIEGTTLGAASNIDGYYVILNVQPGTYKLRVSMIGYASVTVEEVKVNIDQTTDINVNLSSKTIETQEVVVVAKTPIVQRDVAASRVNISEAEIANLPVSSVTSVVGLQAGIQAGLVIRGGSSDQTGFMVNGVMMRDQRDNSPFTGISYTSIDQIQVQTGGFSAEYGDIRSGLVNVVTKQGDKSKYTFSMIAQYSPATPKHFGSSPNDPNSYWIRPYVDGPVAMYGTAAINPATNQPYWDANTQLQYPSWEGWIAYTNKLLQDDDPTNDLSPEAAKKLFLWEHRRNLNIVNPDYILDASFGGPVPVVSKDLGNLRFLASYRKTQTQYVIPLNTSGVNDYVGSLRLTSDVGKGQRVMLQGMLSQTDGTNDNNSGLPGYFSSASGIAGSLNRVSYIDSRIFTPNYWAPTTIDRNSFSGKYTNVLNSSTFYEITVSEFQSRYHTDPGRLRDTSSIYKFGNGYYVDEAPYGFLETPSYGIGSGLRMSVGMSNSRDTSVVTSYKAKFDFQSQLDKYNELKAGAEFSYTDNNVNYGSVDTYLPSGRSVSRWHTFPIQGALYLQDKLEFEGMVATLGLRVDYSDPGGKWFQFGAYPSAFAGSAPAINLDTALTMVETVKQVDFSPRLAIAFPITDNSKLYFNYGHFRQLPSPDDLFLIRRFTDNNAVTRVANPNNPLPKTVAYELGYEQNLLDQLLIRVAGYYKDNSLQPRTVNYISRDNKISYSIVEPDNYGDIRGFELTVTKNRGKWVQGFVNYTYDVSSSGNFGFGYYYENPSDQKNYELTTTSYYQSKPIPQPYARANIDFFTPGDFGPKLAGYNLLGDWRFSFIASWSSGYHLTWTGGGSIPGISNNVQWNDYENVDLRITKSFNIFGADIQLFADVHNLFNYKYMSTGGFADANDYINYMQSLHLPSDQVDSKWYGNIPGNDKPGDSRIGPYIAWDPNADAATKAEWEKNKSYIDMPNQTFLTFLNPRDIFWGLKVSFAINE